MLSLESSEAGEEKLVESSEAGEEKLAFDSNRDPSQAGGSCCRYTRIVAHRLAQVPVLGLLALYGVHSGVGLGSWDSAFRSC